MKRKSEYKVKGANLKQGKKVDHSKLVDKKGMARGKDETDPKIKYLAKAYPVKKKPETIQNFVDMLDEKKNEDIGVY